MRVAFDRELVRMTNPADDRAAAGDDLEAGFDASVPVFGAHDARFELVTRPSAYGLLFDREQRVALVRTRKGCWLPGGGVERGESRAQALVREFREECGFVIAERELVARALQYAPDPSHRRCYAKTSSFHRVELLDGSGLPSELDHVLLWLPAHEAYAQLVARSHAWALEHCTRARA